MDKEAKKYEEKSRKLLFDSVEKKIKTTMIGSLDAIESELKSQFEDDMDFINAFMKARQKILDLGNRQIRNIEKELEDFYIEYKKGVSLVRKGN